MNPKLNEERKLWRKGLKKVACLDEAGRGPLAGPVVAAAVLILNTKYRILNTKIRDSKKLSPKQREKIYKVITINPSIRWGIGRVSEKVIDKINILEATKLAMIKALKNLGKKVDYLILDGNFKIDLPIPQKSIVKADEKVFSCAAASIIAKVRRDRIMLDYHKKFPQYGFDKHKGYPTKYHVRMLKKYGRCDIHRKSYHYGRRTKTKTY
ncbi:MAG: ribonuclease HII [Candidatus Nealsonbacteria bacterium CG15_BIG_FIL_POST_REV_8_21_14_020_37_12]|uniref:Ribonuclease HII n=2 Tax=Candidatus Nealsoniibacteriota TaxID=1817911 RepID=A0A2M7Z413_9BACT|nr:MAG: ribonuclease HII [Candidatus Nealsonbacteria bacterium CG15_BIG_FIL_POST_REV_8_21_14_020_37_12]PJA83911.1 MAG: ribonuclease HII [Candidatus Nealsonbacteria bacterium CG_4_9_14_3_um_filter_37_29]